MDRLILAMAERTNATIGAAAVRQTFGYDGTGVGVAVIDSGVTAWHDDLWSGRRPRIATSDPIRRLRGRVDQRRTTTTATARTSPASSPATASTRTELVPAWRPART